MHPLRIAAATRCFGQPLKQSLRTAAELGVRGIQIDARHELKPSEISATGKRQFLYRLSESGLSVASVWFPTRRSFYEQDQLEARISAAKQAMDMAYQLKAGVLTTRVGRIPTDRDSFEYRTLCEVLNDLARHGNRTGTILALTPTRDTPEQLAELVGNVTEGPLGIDFDPANFVMTGHDPIQSFRALHGHAMHALIRDAIRDVDGTGMEVPVGRGEVPWDEFLALLAEANYHGWLTIERRSGEDKIADIARAVQYLQRVTMG